jgi:hypothetical protein
MSVIILQVRHSFIVSSTVEKMETIMNEEYLAAKANLCLNQAEIDLKQEEIASAIKNLERANSALSRLFGLEGEADDN